MKRGNKMNTKKKISIVMCIIMALTIVFPTSAFAYSDNSISSNSENVSPYYFLAIHYVDVINHGNGYYTLSIYPEGNFSYSFDGGKTWQKSNTKKIYTTASSIEVAMRDTNTYVAYETVILN